MTDRIGAIVLAGGRAARFGRDKLAEPIDGRPLLDYAIAAVRAVAPDDIVVVGAPDADLSSLDGVVLARDKRPFEGPLAGLDAGLASSRADRLIVVAGDMPTLVPAVLRQLLAALGKDATAAILAVEGPRSILPLALSRRPAQAAVHRLVTDGERRLGALLDTLDVRVIAEATWRQDDPDGRTLRDIDRPSDLDLRD